MENDPIAQGTQPAVTADANEQQNQNQNQQGSPPNDSQSGIQLRIDQLTANYREAERRAEEQAAQLRLAQEQNNQLIAQLVNRGPAQSEPQVEVDPELQRQVQAVYGSEFNTIKQTAKQMQAFMAGQNAVMAVQQVAVGKQIAPEVIADAQRFAQAWAVNGLQGWKAEDAIVYAAGQRALNGGAQPQDGRRPFNAPNGSNVFGQPIAPPPTPTRQDVNSNQPYNLDLAKPLDKQINDLESRLGDKAF